LSIRIESWGARGLQNIAGPWRELLARSNADPLFNSPEWLSTWWAHYQPVLGAELEILAAVDDHRLVGLALLHAKSVKHKLGLEGRRVELLGTAWRAQGVGFSERLGFILERGREEQVAAALADRLLDDHSWLDLVASHVHRGGATDLALQHMAESSGGYLRTPDAMEAWEIPLVGSFEDLLASLGAGTRARIMASRKRLSKAGHWQERVLGPDELDHGWEVFSKLHEERWNRPFSAHWRGFYGAIAEMQAAPGTPVLSLLEFEGEPVSLLVNFRAGGREYSIASAFVPVNVKRVSPGWMHLGLAIERAFADGMTHFDLLAGEGKQEQYKAAFGGRRYELACLQLVRHRPLAWLYRSWDGFSELRRRLSRLAER